MDEKPYLMHEYSLYDDPLRLFASMIDDIRNAKKTINLQTYRFTNDIIGQKFRDELTKKAKQGVIVHVLIDSWGSGVSESFFSELIIAGGSVKFFEKIKLSFDWFSGNHRRNHRKLLIIDSKITYIGSANITAHCINWRECTVRINGEIAAKFDKLFYSDFDISNKFYQNKKLSTRVVRHGDIEIIRDVPSNVRQPVRAKYLKFIRSAKEEIVIETPYFLPGSLLRKALVKAAARGVRVIIITPLHSDIKLFDILRDKYFGQYYRKEIRVLQYSPNNLHAKVILVDGKTFFIGSSNFDYRSLRFMHEINISGDNPELVKLIKDHLGETMNDCQEFDYEKWKKRHMFYRIIEAILVPLRHLF